MDGKKIITLIIPCYNEETNIEPLYQALCEVSGSMQAYAFCYLFINDGSGDHTLERIKELAGRDARVRYLSFSRNFGKEAAMYAGFCHAKGDYIAVMDADMQDPPALLEQMVQILESGSYDSVATRRVTRKGEPRIRSFFARKFYKIINRFSDVDIVDGARDFRLMRREMADAVISMREYNRFSKGIFGWVGFRTYWLPYENVERVSGETKWNFWSLFRYAVDGLLNFSQVPLLLASWSGILCTLVSFCMILFVVIRKLIFGDPVAGWASTICVITFIGGIQLFCMGIMGQYIAKTYLEVKKRPLYLIAETNCEEEDADRIC